MEGAPSCPFLSRTIRPVVRGYIQVATKRQVEKGHSLQTQTSLIERFAKEEGVDCVIYGDRGVAAKTLAKRRELLRLLEALTAGDLVVVDEPIRFPRDDMESVYDQITAKGAELIILRMDFSSNGAHGRLLMEISAAIAELKQSVEGALERAEEVDEKSMRMYSEVTQHGGLEGAKAAIDTLKCSRPDSRHP